MPATSSDIVLVTPDPTLITRVNAVASNFGYSCQTFSGIDALMESEINARMVIAFAPDDKNPSVAAEFAQAARFVAPQSFVLCAVSKSLKKDAASFAKKSGANLILLENEFYESSKLEFVVTQVLKSAYLPVKASDLIPGIPLEFDLFHLLPLRQKFLKFMLEGDVMTPDRIKRFTEVGEVYIKRSDSEAFRNYVVKHSDRSAQGIARRCRAQYLALAAGFSSLVFLLTDQSELGSFQEGERLLSKCRDLCRDLLSTLGEFGNAWEIINNSAIGEFGSVERAPAIASYSALFSLQAELDNIDTIMLGALLADLGLIFLPPQITKKIREDRISSLSGDERQVYEKYPHQSLSVLLDRKLSLDESIRNIILSTQETSNGKGFPRHLLGAKIPEESQMIRFSREFDRRTLLRLGKQRQDAAQVRAELVAEDDLKFQAFTPTFLQKLKKGFN
ncbi:MAG: hypothetical protein RJB38_1949 [Pseudomonadota bacterium]|jgi:response regulator RpfG family c-di-GMP phosphodiesterase